MNILGETLSGFLKIFWMWPVYMANAQVLILPLISSCAVKTIKTDWMKMDPHIEKLLVAFMVMIEENGGSCSLDTEAFNRLFEVRHNKGIQVRESKDSMVFTIGDMPVNPDEAMLN